MPPTESIKARTVRLQKERQKELEEADVNVKKRTVMDDWNEASHSVSVPAVRSHTRAKAFDGNLYSKRDADELFNYAKFSLKNPRGSTPASMGGSNDPEKRGIVDVDERRKVVEGGTAGKKEIAGEMNYKHVWVRKKDDLDREFRLLGKGGDFSEVRYQLPLDVVIESQVNGPAAGRRLQREREEQRRLELLKQAEETEDERQKREIKEKKQAKKKRNKELRDDWRTNRIEGIRMDTDFIERIQNIAIGEKYLNPKKKLEEAMRTGPHLFPDYIGPKTRVINYEEVDRVSYAAMMEKGTTVGEQLEGRVVEEKVWDEEEKPLEENRYLLGLHDDQLKEYRTRKRNERLEKTMIEYASRAAGMVEKRNELIAQGYHMPGETQENLSLKLNGVMRRKNLWKIFTRMMVRRRAAIVKSIKDRWHRRKDRPLTKAEKEMLIKESEALVDASDQGNKKLVKTALKFFADVDHRRGGRTSFQMIFTRLCWIDAGLEIEPTWQEGYKKSDRADYDGVMKILLNNGADINTLEGENTAGMAVVHHAARLGCYDRVKFFLENGGKVDLKSANGETALMKACEGGHLDVIMLLVYSQHDVMARSTGGLTMLHFAALNGSLHVIKFLLEAGADKTAVDEDGFTALDICRQRRFRVCAEILEKFAMPSASMKDLVQFWMDNQELQRPESRSLFGSLDSPMSSKRSTSSKMSFRQMRKSRFEKKDRMHGATFGKKGSKDSAKMERNKRRMKEKADREKEEHDRNNPPPTSALGYLEGLMKEVKPPSVFMSKKMKEKNSEAILEVREGGEEPEGEREFDEVLKEVEGEAANGVTDLGAGEEGVKGIEGDYSKEGRPNGRGSFMSFFSPIKKISSPKKNQTPGKEDNLTVRERVKMELFEKMASFSPFGKKQNNQGAKIEGSPSEEEIGPNKENNVDVPSLKLPDIASPEGKIVSVRTEGEADDRDELIERPEKKKKKRRKRQRNKDIDGTAAK